MGLNPVFKRKLRSSEHPPLSDDNVPRRAPHSSYAAKYLNITCIMS